jgi:hypothetical protein
LADCSRLDQTLIPSQPLLAHWFDQKLSLAQVSTTHYFLPERTLILISSRVSQTPALGWEE